MKGGSRDLNDAGKSSMTNLFGYIDRPRIRLLSFVHAGGGASQILRSDNILPADIELCPVPLAGREYRIGEWPSTRVSDGLNELVERLRSRLDVPHAVFGHSLMGLIVFELARCFSNDFPHTPVSDGRSVPGCSPPGDTAKYFRPQ